MPEIWDKIPTLPVLVTKGISLGLFIGCCALKVVDMMKLKSTFNSHCVLGAEVSDNVGVHLFLISNAVSDAFFIVLIIASMPFVNMNFGADPLAIAYNLCCSLLCFGSIVTVKSVEDCGNDAIAIIESVFLFALLAGIFHLINAVTCFTFLQKEEREFKPWKSGNSTNSPATS